eukprot:5676563-Pyramimonas_sp.AAC.1
MVVIITPCTCIPSRIFPQTTSPSSTRNARFQLLVPFPTGRRRSSGPPNRALGCPAKLRDGPRPPESHS